MDTGDIEVGVKEFIRDSCAVGICIEGVLGFTFSHGVARVSVIGGGSVMGIDGSVLIRGFDLDFEVLGLEVGGEFFVGQLAADLFLMEVGFALEGGITVEDLSC